MRTIDLAGSDGNAFALCGIARKWKKQLGENPAGFSMFECESYEAVLDLFDKEFKHRIDYEFINDPRNPETMEDEE